MKNIPPPIRKDYEYYIETIKARSDETLCGSDAEYFDLKQFSNIITDYN